MRLRGLDGTGCHQGGNSLFTPPTRQDKTSVLFHPRRRCEHAIRVRTTGKFVYVYP